MQKLTTLDIVALVLLVVGGFNWGLIGLINYNLVEAIFGAGWIASLIYILVGLSAFYVMWLWLKLERK